MANEALAPAEPIAAPSEDEYQTFCAALSASGRGRAFLAEYARRHRGADTEVLMAALARIEALIRAQRGAEPARGELRALLAVIRGARPEIAARSLPARAAKLAQLLDMLERRIEVLAEAGAPAPGTEARLAVVPPPDEPELPIPSPAAAQPVLTLAVDRTPPAAAEASESAAMVIIPDVSWLACPPPQAEAPAAAAAAAPPDATPLAREPLRPLLMLSDNERLALFT